MKLPLRFLRAVVGLTCVATLGCASSDASGPDDEHAALQKAWNDPRGRIHTASDTNDDPTPEMTVSGDEGSLNAVDIEGAIAKHRDELLDCYGLARRSARRGDRALLRFFVDGKGEVVDVAILESNIGEGRVARCLADIAVGVVLPPPAGHKPTTFDYPIQFRASARPVTASRQRRP